MLKTCVNVFLYAQQRRLSFPLAAGAYKIDEGIRSLQSIGGTIETIQDKIITGKRFGYNEHLGCCLGFERGMYLKSVPKRISETLGYDILPGIAALSGDGWNAICVKSAYKHAYNEARHTISKCDDYHELIKSGISLEYEAMQNGDSILLDLIRSAVLIGEKALKCCDNETA